MQTNQEIQWILMLVLIVCYAKAWLCKRWPNGMRTWGQLTELAVVVTMLFLMVAALYNMTRPAAKPKAMGPSSVAALTMKIAPAYQQLFD